MKNKSRYGRGSGWKKEGWEREGGAKREEKRSVNFNENFLKTAGIYLFVDGGDGINREQEEKE